MVAASVAAVEAMKDQGFCRWNYTLRSLHQHAKNNIRSPVSKSSKKLSSSSSSSAVVSSKLMRDPKAKQSEESLRTVMYLSCWCPNWLVPNLDSAKWSFWFVYCNIGRAILLYISGQGYWGTEMVTFRPQPTDKGNSKQLLHPIPTPCLDASLTATQNGLHS